MVPSQFLQQFWEHIWKWLWTILPTRPVHASQSVVVLAKSKILRKSFIFPVSLLVCQLPIRFQVKEEKKWWHWRSKMKSYSWLKPHLPFPAVMLHHRYKFHVHQPRVMWETKFSYHIHVFQELRPPDAS